jgi:FAD binding domain
MQLLSAAILGVVLLAAPSIQHSRPLPAESEKVLTPNSYRPAIGCKLLASDYGWPSNATWATLKNAKAKPWGTRGPDYTVQPQTVEEVQAAVNFARKHNVRLTMITSGHDFHGR